MAHIIKIKPNRAHEWQQDSKSVFIKIGMPGHTSIKNIEIFLSDVMLKITSKQKKSSKILDLAHEVDYLSPENKFTMVDGVINVNLKKKEPNLEWESLLLEGVSMEEIKARREQSQKRYEFNIKEQEENREKLRNEYDRKATRELMRFQEEERKVLQRKKQEEKEQALNEVFRNNNEDTGNFEADQYKSKNAIKSIDNDREAWQEKGKRALELLEKEQEDERKKLREKQAMKKKQKSFVTEIKQEEVYQQNSMFTDEDVNHFDELRNKVQQQIQIEEIPIRKSAKVSVNFSSKPYPHVAARDYHYADPPMPKDATLFPPTHGDLENKNPLWLKDKGDRFMHDKNYSAAIDAYNQALKIDQSQTKTLMNRSLAYMKTLNINACIHDCDTILLQMQKQLTNSQQGAQQAIVNIVKIKVRKAICLAWKGNIIAAKSLLKQQLEFDLPESIKRQIEGCIESIESREKSIEIKVKGDEKVKREKYSEAIQEYNKSISIDNNEYSISNKSLCLNKLNRFEESSQNAEKGLEIMHEFGVNQFGKNSSDLGNIYMKLLYRKAKALEGSNNIKEAQIFLRKGLEYNPEDRDFKEATKSIKAKQTAQRVAGMKIEASTFIKENRSKEALDIYSKCLKMLESSENTSEYLSILQNQCVCYLKLGEFDSIISVSNRILKLTNNLKNRIVDFDRRKGNMTEEEIKKIMVRTLVRRANAYLKTGRRENAKADLEKAVETDPNDPTVAKQLQKLKQSPVF